MPIELISQPTVIQAAGNVPKQIEEFIGVVNSQTAAMSIAKMTTPPAGQSRDRPPSSTNTPSS